MGTGLKKKLEEIISGPIEKLGYEYVYMTYGNEGGQWFLRVFIDHPEGIGLDDCEKIARHLSRILDEGDPIPGRYILEVSSPGLDRPLIKDRDFERFKDHMVVVKTTSAVNGRRKNEGLLKGLLGDEIIIEVGKEELSIARDIVSSVNLVPQYNI
ncbi:MAG: ribosome maturation factor RimP [Clostridia bacterium]|nr:ribosome maturation factor RimP [Clostridia bacterium]